MVSEVAHMKSTFDGRFLMDCRTSLDILAHLGRYDSCIRGVIYPC